MGEGPSSCSQLTVCTLLLTRALPGGEPGIVTRLSSTRLVLQCHRSPPRPPIPLSVSPGSSLQIKSLSEKSMSCSPNDAERTGGVRQKVIGGPREAAFYPSKLDFLHFAKLF